jgi:hypothetical protein
MARGKIETDYTEDYIAGMLSLYPLFLKFWPHWINLFEVIYRYKHLWECLGELIEIADDLSINYCQLIKLTYSLYVTLFFGPSLRFLDPKMAKSMSILLFTWHKICLGEISHVDFNIQVLCYINIGMSICIRQWDPRRDCPVRSSGNGDFSSVGTGMEGKTPRRRFRGGDRGRSIRPRGFPESVHCLIFYIWKF